MHARDLLARLAGTLGLLGALLASSGRPGPSAEPRAADARNERAASLLAELRCGACHSGLPEIPVPLLDGPDLRAAGTRLKPDYLRTFLFDPHVVQPGTRMPAVIGGGLQERARVSRDLTEYLRSIAPPQESWPAGDVDRGERLFHSTGCVACHAPRRAAEAGGAFAQPADPGADDLAHVALKYRPAGLAAFLFDPLRHRPEGRMPDLSLSREEAADLAAYLLREAPVPDDLPAVDARAAARGSEHFTALRCQACHPLPGTPAAAAIPLADGADLAAGCLSREPDGAPVFPLAVDDAEILRGFLRADREWSDEERVDALLAHYRCYACHARGGRGGVAPEVRPYFGTSEPELGEDASVPPPLTLAGAKMPLEWIQRVLFDGESVRPYMHTRMPQFGEPALGELPDLLRAVDDLPPVEVRVPSREESGEWRDAARRLLGNRGLGCVACHDFNGKETSGFGGVDLITTCERLEPAWLFRFLVAPQELRPGILMPESWSGGVAAHQEILGGDTDLQLQAIWYFLSLGRSAPDPPGIRSEPTFLAVGERARTYRGRSRVAGFRGIAVGFPEGLHYAFDANNGSLAAIWRGDFLSVRWDGQGAGDFHPRGEAIQLARDVALLTGHDADEPWPLRPVTTEEAPVNPDPTYPREHGYRFLGYHLGADDVPTLRYRSGAVEVADRSVARVADGRGRLVREMRLETAAPVTALLRVLAGPIEEVSPRVYRTGGLHVTVPDVPRRLRPAAQEGQSELVLVLDLARGVTTLELLYEDVRSR